jgi:tRNA threonylcarbamoyladenosine biosynthesis protein TsaE
VNPAGVDPLRYTVADPSPPVLREVGLGSLHLTVSELTAWGRTRAASLPMGAIVTLTGDVGAGKTTLVRALVDGLGVRDLSSVTSPTFALIHEYPSESGRIIHADLYRIRDPFELVMLGWDDLIADARAVLVEWPERAASVLPRPTVSLLLAHIAHDASRRALTVREVASTAL